MAVTVTLTTHASDGVREQERVEEGYGFAVRDAALLVLDQEQDGETIAIFAPGQWRSATVDRD